MNHTLRDLKHRARIPIPTATSWSVLRTKDKPIFRRSTTRLTSKLSRKDVYLVVVIVARPISLLTVVVPSVHNKSHPTRNQSGSKAAASSLEARSHTQDDGMSFRRPKYDFQLMICSATCIRRRRATCGQAMLFPQFKELHCVPASGKLICELHNYHAQTSIHHCVLGERSMASCLAGGDLDGHASLLYWKRNSSHFFSFNRDIFDIYVDNPGLLPSEVQTPAEYHEVNQLDIGRPTQRRRMRLHH